MFEQLNEVRSVFADIEARLTQPDVVQNQQLFQKLRKNHSYLQPIVETYDRYRRLGAQLAENEELIKTETGELREMAEMEMGELRTEIATLENRLRILLLPKDSNDERNIVLEIRPAAGGDESGIFAGDLFKMYSRFAETSGWKVEPLSISHNDVGGFKEIIALVKGERVFSRLKFESGVHRVQRVPKTETQGRIHTSTVTVAVLPEADEVEVQIDPNELRIDVYRSGGPGGQSVNTTDSAVRITHLPTKLVVICQDEKSQHKNKAKALKILMTRLLDMKQREQHEKISSARASQIGSGERSEKIRTYNFPQGRVTDHRIGVTIHRLEAFLEGEIGEMIQQLSSYYEAEALKTSTIESAFSGIAALRDELRAQKGSKAPE